jgi:RND superfamily putative drug exporter
VIASAGLLYSNAGLADLDLAMNFALMFALALGIDYALFIVSLPGALRPEAQSRRGGGDDDGHGRQGRPLLGTDRAGLALGGDAGAEPRVPLDLLGIIVSVLFVLAATLTLLPAMLAKLGPRVDRLSLPWAQPPASLCALRPLG